MKIYRRGKVTRENSIFHKNGSVSCIFSTNSCTDDEYFTLDQDKFHLVEGKSWCVHNDRAHTGLSHFNIRTGKRVGKTTETTLLHSLLFQEESISVELTVDHLLHWTDNRRASVDFITLEENQSRGAALYHVGRKARNTSNQKGSKRAS